MASERTVGARVKAIRQERGLLQKWVAKKAGWTQQRLSRFENGHIERIPVQDASALAKALGLKSVDDLLTMDHE